MKLYPYILLVGLCTVVTACDDTETYAEQKDREQSIIRSFIDADTRIVMGGEELCHVGKITFISEADFLANDTTTRCEVDDDGNYIYNEYVQLSTGLIMQIVRRGAGEVLRSGQSKLIVARYFEYNMSHAYVASRNTTNDYHRFPDIISVSNSYGTITGSFDISINRGGAMYRNYGATTVPEGWLAPLRYVRIGNQNAPEEGIAKVRIIVPHSLGHSVATGNVHPYFYEITFSELY